MHLTATKVKNATIACDAFLSGLMPLKLHKAVTVCQSWCKTPTIACIQLAATMYKSGIIRASQL